MKSIKILFTAGLFAVFTLSACNQSTQNENDQMDDEMEDMHSDDMHEEMGQHSDTSGMHDMNNESSILVNYMDIKNALFNDNYELAKKEAEEFLISVKESKDLNASQVQNLQNTAQKISQVEEAEKMRENFANLSKEMYQVVQNNDLTDKTLYWSYCPMAMNNVGANWLSYQETIQNPFMGQRMPRCGSVKETIK